MCYLLQADKNAEKTMKIVGEAQKVTYQLSTLAANNYHLRIILTRKTVVSPWVQSFTTILLDTFPVAIPLVVYPEEQRKCIEKMGIVFSDRCNGSIIRYTLNPHFCIRFLKDALGLDGIVKAADEGVVRYVVPSKYACFVCCTCADIYCVQDQGHLQEA